MALYVLQSTDHGKQEKTGRPFRCSKCLYRPNGKKRMSIANARRCFEDRWDFTEKDGAAFPIQMSPGGPLFSFCPAKVLRDDPETVQIFEKLTAILETNTWPKAGGIDDQEAEWVELVAEFGPFRRDLEFNTRYGMIAEAVSQMFGGKGKK